MSHASELRDRIVSFKGGEFTTHDLPKYDAMYTAVAKLVKSGEIKLIRRERTGGRPLNVYVEVKIRPGRRNESKELKAFRESKTPMPNWCKVWPEFFATPTFVTGKVTNINRWSECHE